MGLVAVMGYELSRDVFRASQLVGELQASKDGLRENEQRMSLAVDAANLGIWIRDLARNEIWASDKWRELFSFTPSEPLDLESILQRLHPDDREALQQVLAKALAGGGSYETEFRVTLPEGGLRWISSRGQVEFDVTGQPVRVRGVSRDISAQKQAEQETQLLRREVAHVARVTMMGQLASALAHEINQPLGAILRNAEAAELFCRTRHRTLTKSARSLPTSARTTSVPAPSSTGCADCSSGNPSIRKRSTWANSLAMSGPSCGPKLWRST